MSEYTGPKTDDQGQATYAYVVWMQDEIERLRDDASYQCAAQWRDKYHAAEAEIDRLRADNDRLYAAIRDILASPPAGVSNAVVSEVERLP